MTTGKIALLSPMYTEDERWVANEIKTELANGNRNYRTYQPYTDGLDGQLFEFLADGTATVAESKRAILLSSALNFYNLIQVSDASVLVLDGRTPDEGSVFWAAVAFASGKPVVVYKSDYRTFMSTGDNPMVTGLSLDYEPVKDIKKLNDRVDSQIKRYNKNPWKGEHLPGYNKLLLSLGEKVWEGYKGRRLTDILVEMKNDPLVETLIPHEEKEYPLSEPASEKVYCSGPLFCPAEIREISSIAEAIEKEGLLTYLPHRDGVEAMIGDLDNTVYRNEAMRGHMADINAFTIDLYQLVQCHYFAVSINGRVPDDGAVSEAGMAFAMGLPSVLYRSDLRAFFSGVHGFVHPALQMAGYLFDPTADYGEICDKLMRHASFISTQGNQYSQEIHQEVNNVYTLGKHINEELNAIYTGNVLLPPFGRNRFLLWRLAHIACKPKIYGKFWREYHPYSKWPDSPGPQGALSQNK